MEVLALAEAGSDALLNWTTAEGHTTGSLHITAQNGTDIVRMLLRAGARISLEADGGSSLDAACFMGQLDAVLVLVRRVKRGSRTCLHGSCREGSSAAVVRELVRAGGAEPVQRTDVDGWTGLHRACNAGNLPEVRELVSSTVGRTQLARRTADGM
jgi:ankyrin repeat protein